MLQRSPTYIISQPGRDAIAISLRRWLPAWLAFFLTRWKNVAKAPPASDETTPPEIRRDMCMCMCP